MGAGAAHVLAAPFQVGAYMVEKNVDNAKEFTEKTGTDLKELTEKGMGYVDDARKDAKEFTENIVKVGADGVENFRKGAENVTKEGIDLLKVGVKQGVGIKFGESFSAGIGVSGTDTLEAKLEMKEKEVSRLEKELEAKNERIKKLEENQEKLTAQIVQVALK